MSMVAMTCLGIAYIIITVLCAIEKHWWDALYLVGALVITLSLMGRR